MRQYLAREDQMTHHAVCKGLHSHVENIQKVGRLAEAMIKARHIARIPGASLGFGVVIHVQGPQKGGAGVNLAHRACQRSSCRVASTWQLRNVRTDTKIQTAQTPNDCPMYGQDTGVAVRKGSSLCDQTSVPDRQATCVIDACVAATQEQYGLVTAAHPALMWV